jgi:hypothetical protein
VENVLKPLVSGHRRYRRYMEEAGRLDVISHCRTPACVRGCIWHGCGAARRATR